MQVWGVTSTQATQAAGSVGGIESSESVKAAAQQPIGDVHDAVSLSEGVSASDMAAAGDVRMDRVRAIRAAIADGSYETAEKLDIALDRLLDSIG